MLKVNLAVPLGGLLMCATLLIFIYVIEKYTRYPNKVPYNPFIKWINNSNKLVVPVQKDVPLDSYYSLLYPFTAKHNQNSMQYALLTQWAQSFIHQHQNPENCTKAKILVTDGWSAGIGSVIHVVGTHLAYAMEHGHVLVWGPASCDIWVDQETCKKGCECIFQKLSHCVAPENAERIGSAERFIVPSILTEKLLHEYPSMTPSEILYWWRAQSIAYIMRLQPEALREISDKRQNTTIHYMTGHKPIPFPLPTGTINMHIRSGDKHVEMKLIEPQVYVDKYLAMVQSMPLSYARTVLITSDNMQHIEYCRDRLENQNHTVIYTYNERKKGGHYLQHVQHSVENKTKITLSHVQQLLMTLEADGWIGTRGSNWNRLIDVLRCVWVPKCQMRYEEVGVVNQDGEYGWR
jgi:hypothetical protein